tara:strand:+ start:12480 stop:12956 length:477 start_codon:yes stop_codon:yes gene_type:complete
MRSPVALGSGTAEGGVSPASFARRSHCGRDERRRSGHILGVEKTNIGRDREERTPGAPRKHASMTHKPTCSSRDFIAALEPGVDGAMAAGRGGHGRPLTALVQMANGSSRSKKTTTTILAGETKRHFFIAFAYYDNKTLSAQNEAKRCARLVLGKTSD